MGCEINKISNRRNIRHFVAEIITIRFAAWISGRIVSLQPVRISKNRFQTETGYKSEYPKRF